MSTYEQKQQKLHKKHDLFDIEAYSEEFPWYKEFIESAKATLRAVDNRRGSFHYNIVGRSTPNRKAQ